MKINISSASLGFFDRNLVTRNLQSRNHQLILNFYNDKNFTMRSKSFSNRMRSKIPKMLSHQFINADWYIWIDSKFIINNNFFIDDIISNADNKKLILFKHPDRKNISEEVDFNLSLIKTSSYLSSRYKNEPIKQQFEKYIQDKNFKDNKLFSMGFFAYHKDLKELMNLWFYENCLWTLHDQISFPYVLQKYNAEYKILNCNILDNSWFTHRTVLKSTDRYTLLQSYIKSFL